MRVVQPLEDHDDYRMEKAHVLWIEGLDGVPEIQAKSFIYPYASSLYKVSGITVPDGFDDTTTRCSHGVNASGSIYSALSWLYCS